MRSLDGGEAELEAGAVEDLLQDRQTVALVGEVRASDGSEARSGRIMAEESRKRTGKTLRVVLGAATDAEALNAGVRAVAEGEVRVFFQFE